MGKPHDGKQSMEVAQKYSSFHTVGSQLPLAMESNEPAMLASASPTALLVKGPGYWTLDSLLFHASLMPLLAKHSSPREAVS